MPPASSPENPDALRAAHSPRPVLEGSQLESTSPAPEADSALRGFRLVGLCTLASRILGMLRDVAMASAFGAGPLMDAFSLAFRIPNLARRLFGEGAQTSAFLPAFVRTLEQSGRPAAQHLAGGMFLSLGLILAGLVATAEATLGLLWWLAPLSDDARLLVELLMWLVPYLIAICLAAQQAAVLHGLRQFLWPALIPIVLNLIWLAAIPVVIVATADPLTRMRGLCASILLAGLLQLLLPMVVLRRQGFPWVSRIGAAAPQVRDIFRAMTPILLGVSVTQVNTVLDSVIAWSLAPGTDGRSLWGDWLPLLPNGTASALYFGQRMYQFPLGLIGVALGTVLFPQFARHAQRGDSESLRRDLSSGLQLTFAIGLPAGLGLMLLAGPITRLLFEHGAFTPAASRLTAQMIVAYGPGVTAFIGLLVVQRAYYAVGDRLTPLHHSLVAMIANLLLDVGLLGILGAPGLAWATSLAACLQLGLAVSGLRRHCGSLAGRPLLRTALQALAACSVMALTVQLVLPAAGTSMIARVWSVAVPITIGSGAYFLAAALLGLHSPWRIVRHGRL